MAKSLVDYIFRYMASKFLSQDEKDAVGIINRQMTLSDAPVVSGEAAVATPPPAADATPAGGAPTPSAHAQEVNPARSAGQDSEASASRSGSAAQDVPEVPQPMAEKSGSSLLDGLKIVAQNSAAATREARLNAGQAPVVFDTADSPACTDCGSIMVRNGSCYKCINCGATSGCS
jgi:ribonucleoside-diphosphate reductase alpha chain